MRRRQGMTLIELLVVIGIIAILIGLMLPAVLRLRALAAWLESCHQLKQINLATHHFASVHQQQLPSLKADETTPNLGLSVFAAVLPFLEHNDAYMKWRREGDYQPPPLRILLSPADPTIGSWYSPYFPVCSYAANAQVFRGRPSMTSTFRDGTSNTITFAEHYASACSSSSFDYTIFWTVDTGVGRRRATFADGRPNESMDWELMHDIYPVTSGNPARSIANEPPWTFQVAPRVEDCYPWVAQTPHRNGMLTGYGDGSVRTIAPNVSAHVYWGAVTPRSGDNVYQW